jgi:hypothetical protein
MSQLKKLWPLPATWLIFATLLVCGCSQPVEPVSMPRLERLSIEQLREVDIAATTYQDDFVEIEGVVSEEGQGGWPRNPDYSVHSFSFAAWRRLGGELVEEKLTILRPVEKETDWFSEFPKLSIHRVKVLLSDDETRAIFSTKSENPPDTAGLREVAKELSQPVVVANDRFGDLTLNRSLGWFEAETEWNDAPVRLSLRAADTERLTQVLPVAEKLWSDGAIWNKRVEDYAVEKLLRVKNDNWLEDGDQPLTSEEFKSHMSLDSITVDSDGSFEVWYSDGDLFWGHSILIRGSLEEGLYQADIAG